MTLRNTLLSILSLFAITLHSQSAKPSVTRTFTSITGSDDYNVTITIHAEGILGFAKYEETIPENAKIKNPSADQTCTIRNDSYTLKFIWTSIPTCGEMILTYRITFPYGKLPAQQMNYPGTFRYLFDNVACTVSVQ